MESRLTKNEAGRLPLTMSPADPGRVRRGLARLVEGLAALGRAIAEYPARRRAYEELRAMTDRELADIGLTRAEIGRVFDPDFRAPTTATARGAPAFRNVAGGGRAAAQRPRASATRATAPAASAPLSKAAA